ncbi:MAG: protein kinase [Deltaproteobacteria bacterium]
MADPTQVTLGGYTLVEPIGRGGMGEVWRAERIGAGGVRRRAAVKRILPQFQGDAVLHERFIAEARINSRLEHPNIVQVLHFDITPEPYLVLEYVDGLSVADLLRRGATGQGKLPLASALYIVAEAADALDYAHRRTDDDQRPLGIVHRDVSPPNILVSLDGAVKVNDFGVARAADNLVRTQAGLSVGKLVYMAPEQALGSAVDRRADVFALGVVLWELLTLRPLLPRNGSTASLLENLQRLQFTPPSALVSSIPPAIDAIVREALERDPAARTASAGRMGKALRMVLHAVAPGFDRRDLADTVRDAVPDLAGRASSERGTWGGSARHVANLWIPNVAPAPSESAREQVGPAARPRQEAPDDLHESATRFDGSPMPTAHPAEATVSSGTPPLPPTRDLAEAPAAGGRASVPRVNAPPAEKPSQSATASSAPGIEKTVGAPPAPGALSPAPRPVANRATPPSPRSKGRALRVVLSALVVLALGSAGGFGWYTYGPDLFGPNAPAPNAPAAPAPAPARDPAYEALRAMIGGVLPAYVGMCRLGLSAPEHGVVRADFTFQPSGEMLGARVVVDAGATQAEQSLAACVQRYVWVLRAQPTERGLTLENITATF